MDRMTVVVPPVRERSGLVQLAVLVPHLTTSPQMALIVTVGAAGAQKRRSAGGGTALGPDSRQFRGGDDGDAEVRNYRENRSFNGDF